MSLRRPTRLQLQQLEDRSVPAVTTQLVGGLLIISGDNLSNTITLKEVGTTGEFVLTNKVGAGVSKTVGTFSFSRLNVVTGKGDDVFDLRINSAIAGNVTVTMGNGSDFFTTANSAGGPARIGGNLMLDLGHGSKLGVTDLLDGQTYDQAALLHNMTVGGSVTVRGAAGNGAELVDVANSTIAGGFMAVNVYQTSLGSTGEGLDPVFVGSVTVNNAQKNTDSRSDAYVGGGNDLFFMNNVFVAGGVTYFGGAGQDTVELPGDPETSTPAIINGSVLFAAGQGNSTLSLGNGFVGAQVAGNVMYLGGSGIDRLFLDSGATVGGNLTANLGNGDNQIFGSSAAGFMGPVDPLGSAVVAGNLLITAGNGNNYIGTYDGDGTELTVGGNLTIRLGNGNPSGGPAAAPTPVVTFFNNALLVVGTATYQAGTGANSLDITNETIADLRLRFGNGATTVLFNQASGSFQGQLLLDFGPGGPKTLGGTATVISFP